MLNQWDLHQFAIPLFENRDGEGMANLVRQAYPNFDCVISFDAPPRSPLIINWTVENGTYRYSFSPNAPEEISRIYAHRWISMLGLFDLCRRSLLLDGHLNINLGDQGDQDEIHFCGNQNGEFLIPDSDFLSSHGYIEYKQHITDIPWQEKINKVFWRGSTTGIRESADVLDLPRIRLCLLAKDRDLFNCKISHFVQVTDEEKTIVSKLNIEGDFVSPKTFKYYKYHIDIDGNTNAWSGLFYKLLSGGLVIKVTPPHDHKQWFYDKLVPWQNFVPVKSDFSDLDDVLARLHGDDELAQSIAARGQQLAFELDYKTELENARDRISEAFRRRSTKMSKLPDVTVTREGEENSNLLATLLANAVDRGLKSDGKVSHGVLQLKGMSGKNYRYAINNLIASVPDARYLEVGSWAGSTACAAMEGNRVVATCIDNWSEFGGPKEDFLEHTLQFRGAHAQFRFIESDFRKVDFRAIGKFNVYLFDGPHDEKDQYDGLALALPALDEQFIFIVDDWNWDYVRRGTMSAIAANKLKIEYMIQIRTTQDNSHPEICRENSEWHNGYFLSVLRKQF